MIKEVVKSTILVILVLSSTALTYMVWTYEPEFSEIDTSVQSMPSAGQGEMIEFTTAIRAYQTVWVSPEEIQGTNETQAVVGMRELLAGSEIENVQVYNDMYYLESDFNNSFEEFLVIDYPSDMPIKSLIQVLEFESDVDIPDLSFVRIVVNLSNDNIRFHFIDESLEHLVTADIDVESVYLKNILEQFGSDFEDYSDIITSVYTSNPYTAVYAPTHPGENNIPVFLSTEISVEVFNQILFLNSNYTTTREENGIEMFESEDEAVARFNSNTYRYLFTNVNETISGGANAHRTIRRTFDFLNSHRALTRDSVLFEYDDSKNASIYRQTVNGKFVFSERVPSSIEVMYGDNAVYQYERPQIRPNVSIPNQEMIELPPVETVRYNISVNENLNLELVSKFMVAYNMTFSETQSELNLLRYEPSWYVKYDGEWYRYENGGLK